MIVKLQRDLMELEVGSQVQLAGLELRMGKVPGTKGVFLFTQEVLHSLSLLEGQFCLFINMQMTPGIKTYQLYFLSPLGNMPGALSSKFKGKNRLDQLTCLTKTTHVFGCWTISRLPLSQAACAYPLSNQPRLKKWET